jgi:hypothetical protein
MNLVVSGLGRLGPDQLRFGLKQKGQFKPDQPREGVALNIDFSTPLHPYSLDTVGDRL